MSQFIKGTPEYKDSILRGVIAYIVKQLPETVVFDGPGEDIALECVTRVQISDDVEKIICHNDKWWNNFMRPIIPALKRNDIKWTYWGDESGFTRGVSFSR